MCLFQAVRTDPVVVSCSDISQVRVIVIIQRIRFAADLACKCTRDLSIKLRCDRTVFHTVEDRIAGRAQQWPADLLKPFIPVIRHVGCGAAPFTRNIRVVFMILRIPVSVGDYFPRPVSVQDLSAVFFQCIEPFRQRS